MSRSALALLVALAADLALSDPPNRWHPVAWAGRAIGWGRRRLAHGSGRRLRVTGAIVVVVIAATAAVLAWTVDALLAPWGIAGILLEGLVLKTTLSARGLATAALRVATELESRNLPAARAAVSRDLVSRPTMDLDDGGVASAAVESVAENVTDSLVAPLVFFAVFGLVGAAVYRVVNTADAMIGYREGVLEGFGKVAARADDVLNFVPARLAAVLLALCSALAGERMDRAFRVLVRDHALTASPNAGWTMSAMAGALGVTLEKRGSYRLGEGPPPTAREIRRSVRVFAAASALASVLTICALSFR